MTAQPLIDLQGIKKIFYTDEIETWALDNIHLTIGQGEYVSITGPSGCGKSTLLSVMGLLNSSTEGKYFLNGTEVTELAQAEQARVRNQQIGFIFQAFNLIGEMSVFENVELPLTYRKDIGTKQRKDMVSGRSTRRPSFPAASSSASRSRGRLSENRRYCSPTNRPETSIRRMRRW
jgi:putative ABC transport system ATP-binding protein